MSQGTHLHPLQLVNLPNIFQQPSSFLCQFLDNQRTVVEFIPDLPVLDFYSCILVAVVQFSKACHLVSLQLISLVRRSLGQTEDPGDRLLLKDILPHPKAQLEPISVISRVCIELSTSAHPCYPGQKSP